MPVHIDIYREDIFTIIVSNQKQHMLKTLLPKKICYKQEKRKTFLSIKRIRRGLESKMRKKIIETRHITCQENGVKIKANPRLQVINMTPQHGRYKKITMTKNVRREKEDDG